MKIIKLILISVMMCNLVACHAQKEKKAENKELQIFLDKFSDVTPPLNYKKMKHKMGDVTKKEAIQFLQKKESELYYNELEFGLETEDVSYTKQENLPGYDFKYLLNDSMYVLCTREAKLGGEIDTIISCLYSFTSNGKIIDKCIIAGWYSENEYIDSQFSCIFLNRNVFRVYFYEMNNETKEKDFLSTVYYIEYQIAEDGIISTKYQSGVAYLKKYPDFYRDYDPKMQDDPMNDYDF
ncbi:MAG: hypothetical protein LBV46_01170 [Bacteroidales bacterium]|jgi:hypothetical protein|nr:hypothetical protein [Bacteroidales bacterium]